MKTFFLALLLSFAFSSISSTAHAEDWDNAELTCTFQQRFSTDWENVNDYFFDDYEWLIVKPVPGGYAVLIGAMSYGDEDEETTQPSDITKTVVSPSEVVYVNAYEGNPWTLKYDPTTKTVVLWGEDESSEGQLEKYAAFYCQQGLKQ